MDFEKVAEKLGDWGPKLRPFVESEEFDKIFRFLKQQKSEGKVICPDHTDTFRAFKLTPYSKLKCIFILQDPYPWMIDGKLVADGLAMSCSHTGKCQPSLDLFYDGMEEDLGEKVPHEPDLSYLAQQGVLFLNTSLTVELYKPTSHEGLWDKFMDYLIQETINFYNSGLIYVSFGKHAQVATKAILPFLHWGFEVEHPAAAAHSSRTWDHQNIFTKINKILRESNNEQINWIYGKELSKPAVGGGTKRKNTNTL